MGAIFSRGCMKKTCNDLGGTCDQPLLENTCCDWFKWVLVVLFLLVFYTYVFSSLVIGSQALSLYGDVKNITNNGTCATMGTVNTYFLVTGIVLVVHSCIRLVFDISASCWYWLQNTGEVVTTYTWQDMMGNLLVYHVESEENTRLVRWFNYLWDLALFVPLGLACWGLATIYMHSDARECDTSAWDIFHLQVWFIFGYILAAMVFYAISHFMFQRIPVEFEPHAGEPAYAPVEPSSRFGDGAPDPDVEDLPPVAQPLGSAVVNTIVNTPIPLFPAEPMTMEVFRRLVLRYKGQRGKLMRVLILRKNGEIYEIQYNVPFELLKS